MRRLLMGVVVALVMAMAGVAQAAVTLTAADWYESWTDASGNYAVPPAPGPGPGISVSSGSLIAPIPTDANQSSPDNEVVNYVRTRTDVGTAASDYNGSLLGNLSGKTALTATFSLNNSALGAGATLTNFVGETYPGSPNPTPGLRLVFTGTGTAATAAADIPNEWWSNPIYANALTMQNGVPVTLTVNFDPSQWSNYNGIMGTADLTDFDTALSGVTMLGISFGSGYFFSDGFAFDPSDSTASLDLISIDTTGPVPEPATIIIWSLLGGLGLAVTYWRRKRAA